jgi:hypothetical protein
MGIDGGYARWKSRPAPVPHDDPCVSVQATGGFLENDRGQLRTKFARRHLFESQPRVEWHVPRDGSKGRQGDLGIPSIRRPLADRPHQRGPDAASSVRRQDLDFLQMRKVVCEHFDQREADRDSRHNTYPETTIRLRGTEGRGIRLLVQHGLGGVAPKELGRFELDRRERVKVGRQGVPNRVVE